MSTKTYNLNSETGVWSAQAIDTTGTYESSETSTPLSNTSTRRLIVKGGKFIRAGGKILLGEAPTYTITPTLTNVTGLASNPTTITQGGTATLTYTADSGYTLPASVSVTGATGIWTQATGALELSNPTGNVTFSIQAESILPAYSCTISGLGSESPSNVTFVDNGIFPELEEVTQNGSVFIKVPRLYKKINSTDTDGQITSYTVATNKVDNSYKLYPAFYHYQMQVSGSNVLSYNPVTESSYILIGKYGMTISDGVAKSTVISGTPTFYPIASCRTAAAANGAGYSNYDWMIMDVYRDLCLCKSHKWDFNPGYAADWTSEYIISNINYPMFVDGLVCKENYPSFIQDHSKGGSVNVFANPFTYTYVYCRDYEKYCNSPAITESSCSLIQDGGDESSLYADKTTGYQYFEKLAPNVMSSDPSAQTPSSPSVFTTKLKNFGLTSLPFAGSIDINYRHKYYCDMSYMFTDITYHTGPAYHYMFNTTSSDAEVRYGLYSLIFMRETMWNDGRMGRLCYRPNDINL